MQIRTGAAHLFPYFCALFPIVLPLYRFRLSLLSLSISLLELYVGVVISGGVILLLQHHYSLSRLWTRKKQLLIFSSIFIATGAIGLGFSADTRFALGIFRVYFVEHFIAALLFWCLYDVGVFKSQHIRFAFMAGALLLFFVGGHTLLQCDGLLPSAKPWINDEPQRASSLFLNPNSLGLLIAPFVTFYAVACLHTTEHASRDRTVIILSGFASLFGLIAILLSRSDGALVAFIVGVSAYLLFSRHARRFLLIAVFLGCLLMAVPDTRTYITRAFTEKSAGTRIVLWENTFHLLQDHPIQGAGLGTFKDLYKFYRTSPKQESPTYPHMIILNFWVELGVVGLSAVAGMVYVTLQNTWHRIHREKHFALTGLFCVWVTVLVHGLVDVPFFNNDLSLLWWLLVWA